VCFLFFLTLSFVTAWSPWVLGRVVFLSLFLLYSVFVFSGFFFRCFVSFRFGFCSILGSFLSCFRFLAVFALVFDDVPPGAWLQQLGADATERPGALVTVRDFIAE